MWPKNEAAAKKRFGLEMFANIRLSRARDIPFLRRIYRRSFGDGLKSEDLLFRDLYREDNCYVLTRFGTPAAMAFALPATIRGGEREWRGLYLYAVATHPRWRHRGYSSRLIERIHADAQAGGMDFALLVPATDELFGFYARLGYEKIGQICRYEYAPAAPLLPEPPLAATPVSGERYGQARELRLDGENHLVWREELLVYQSKMLTLFKGGFYLLLEEGREIGCAAVSWSGGVLDVQEILVPPEKLTGALTALAIHHGAGLARARLEAGRGEDIGLRTQALAVICAPPALRADLSDLYVALVMD
ncbi:MAG: GNAT family N-acetyltransferase [Gracilibacteraceae bacterium]|jgi:N-acetylglutamate synthase-like GNAT family acetyltransferase|nr:GNAT family N-acetyltransferase [Gracilibacteraceae bacterium]